MKVTKTELDGAFLIEPQVFGDYRGWFMESYSYERMCQYGLDAVFVQDNRSKTQNKGTIRGLHFQTNPKCQSKLVTCLKGSILDVAVDLRKDSPTYLKWMSIELNEENKHQLFIPKGFAHGFLTLTDDVEIEYKVDDYYSPEHDRSIRFDDPQINVDWGIADPILSEKDKSAPLLRDSDANF